MSEAGVLTLVLDLSDLSLNPKRTEALSFVQFLDCLFMEFQKYMHEVDFIFFLLVLSFCGHNYFNWCTY